MATTDQARRNRALLSVYHYGRKQPGKPLHGRPTPLTLMPLHHAVSVLVKEPLEDHGDQSLHAIRLALADLCRTRGGGRNSKVDRQIARLATAFSRVKHRENPTHDHAETVRSFAEIFANENDAQKSQTEAETDAYQAALHRMVASGEEDRALPPPARIWPITPSDEDREGAPANYGGTARVRGKFADMVARLDPQRWHDAFPYIWSESFRTEPDYFVMPPSENAAAAAPESSGPRVGARPGEARRPLIVRSRLPLDETHAPPQGNHSPASTGNGSPGPVSLLAPQPSDNLPALPPGPSTLYEEALFGGYVYRNVLNVSFTTPKVDGCQTATYEYSQRACLETTRDPLDVQGGIDVDSGVATVVEIDEETVQVNVNKQVRFTKPAFFVQEMNDLAHVYVPLSLDSWIHGLIFSAVVAESPQPPAPGPVAVKAKEEKSDGKDRSAELDRGRPEHARRPPSPVG